MERLMWDPGQYLRFGGERARPFFDLLARVSAEDPGHVADLGCGPGNLTVALARRWPRADVVGVDNSAEMIEAAKADSAIAGATGGGPGSLSFALCDIRDWTPARNVDVVTCNAVLQWVPGHLELLARWAGLLAPGGWLAFQLPGNFDQPSHLVLRELAASPRWLPLLADVELNRQAEEPAVYVDVLARAGCEVDAWETTYLHVLQGDDPVLDWYKGTGLRPVLAGLSPGHAEEFLAEYGARVRSAYPAAPYGTVLPFRRIFAVGRKARS
jgi:trans-aconitate 2-methyltransferase